VKALPLSAPALPERESTGFLGRPAATYKSRGSLNPINRGEAGLFGFAHPDGRDHPGGRIFFGYTATGGGLDDRSRG
jgi:hypothetical protein